MTDTKLSDDLRVAGFAADATDYPRDVTALRLLCAFVGVDWQSAPPGWWYHPNESTRAAWQRVADEARSIFAEERMMSDIDAISEASGHTKADAEIIVNKLRELGFAIVPNLEQRAIDCLQKMQEVTTVLGKGVGNITTPDGFFALWNDAENEASVLINRFKPE